MTITRTIGVVVGAGALMLGLAGCPIDVGGDLPIAATNTVGACSSPGTTPKFIAIVMQGISSSVNTNTSGAATFDPSTQSYCTSPDGTSPPDNPQAALQDMADGWLNWKCPVGLNAPCMPDGPATASYPNDLIDALAHAGGYVLPFSYTGATMSGTSAHPVFTFNRYGADDVANNDPRYDEPPILQAEVASIHTVFPFTPIVVIGHSNGGLIAEQWWVRYRPVDVAHIFSLDSPISGVARAGPACQLGVCGSLGVGAPTANAYVSLWQGSASDPTDGTAALLALDSQDHQYTASGTYGDPLYDLGDAIPGSPAHNGILSQLILDPHCLAAERTTSAYCAPIAPFDFVSPCGSSLQSPADSSYNDITYGMPGSLSIHSEAKNCTGTVNMIISYVSGLISPSAPTSPPTPATPATPATPTTVPTTSTSASPSTSATITPGHSTPEDAVDGFYAGELAGDWTAACSYLDPPSQGICTAGTSGQGAATGHFAVGHAVHGGSQALVPVTGTICAPSSPCASNSDPNLGMPRSPSQFAASYAQAVANGTSSGNTVLSPMPCDEAGGEWYVTFA